MLNQPPTFPRILFLQGFFHTLIIGISVIVIEGFILSTNFDGDPLLTLIKLPLLILIIGMVIWVLISIKQYRRVLWLMERGYKTQGKIIEKYRGYVTYEYKHHGQIYRASERFFWTYWKKFKVGQDITVVVSHQSPAQSLFYDLYQ